MAGRMIDEDVALAPALSIMARRFATVVGVIYQLTGIKGMTERRSHPVQIERRLDAAS
jgi:hypothetical protein